MDIIEALILASKVEQKIRSYHQSLVYSGYTLSILKHFSPQSLHTLLTWETIQTLMETLLLMIDENLGGKADRKRI